jgi:organic radical activating enzyme
MKLKGVRMEDFTNYKKPSMYIAFPYCTFKCERECGQKMCQNSALATAPNIEVNAYEIVNRYLNNPITQSIVMAGLEPFDSPFALPELIQEFRKYTNDDIIIYTGYTKDELRDSFTSLREAYDKVKQFKNIIIKFGRFIPNQQPHYDDVLGIYLASDNQYAERIS